MNFFPMVQVEPNKYFSDISSLSEGISVRVDESETPSRSTRVISTRCQNIRRKFHKCMNFFLVEGGSCSYDDGTIGNIEEPLRYKHLVEQWVPKYLPQINIYFCVNKRILICHSGLGTENTVSQRIQTDNHKISKMVLQWK